MAQAHDKPIIKSTLIWAVGLVAAGVAAFHNSFGGAWVFDDFSYVVENEYVRALWTFGSGFPHPFRPVLEWTFSLNYLIGGLDVTGYHVFNLIVHLLAGLTLFGVVRRTLLLPGGGASYRGAATPLAGVVALLWLVHPLQTESVTYIAQRSESLMGLLFLVGMYGLIRGNQASGWIDRWAWYALVVVAFALACAVKEIIITALPVMLLYDRVFLAGSWAEVQYRRWSVYMGCTAGIGWLITTSGRVGVTTGDVSLGLLVLLVGNLGYALTYPRRDSAAGRWIRRGLELGASAGFAVSLVVIIQHLLDKMKDYTSVLPMNYARTQTEVVVHYLKLVFWPQTLCLDHDWPVSVKWDGIIMPAGILGLLGLATLWALWQRPRIGVAAAAFFIILAPTSSVIPLRELAVEHRMYLPLASVIILMVLAGYTLINRMTAERLKGATQAGLVIVAVLAFGLRTVARNEDYRSPATLWTQSLELYPKYRRAHLNLAQIYTEEGRYEVAYAHYRQGLPFIFLKDELGVKVYYNFGVTLQALKQHNTAEAQYRLAIRYKPRGLVAAASHNQLGLLAADRNNMRQARRHFQDAVRADPSYAMAHKNLGVLHAMENRTDLALASLREAVRLQPDFAEAHFALGEVLEQQGEVDLAATAFREALRLNPDLQQALEQFHNQNADTRNP